MATDLRENESTLPSERPIAPQLMAELEGGKWMYEWQLTPTVRTPLLGPNLPTVHATREQMIEPVVRAALAAAGPHATAIDLACNEGWFSQRLLAWGAHRVVGVDVRPETIRRAELVRDHFEIPADRLSFMAADVFELDPEQLGRFDVALVLGLLYHVERPIEVIRIARRLGVGVCVIESQLSRQEAPIVFGDGTPNVYLQTPASFAARMEEQPDNPLASTGAVASLVPNRGALELMPRWAGFDSVEFLKTEPHHDVQYVVEDRAIVVARMADTPRGRVTGLPLPPAVLRHRVGATEPDDDPALAYERKGAEWRELITQRLPRDWDWRGKRVLDFGAGAGRVLRHFHRESMESEFWACDIDAPSIQWLQENLNPPFQAFQVAEEPSLPQQDGYFDLIWAASVFTHLTDHWAGWMLELHRVLASGGLLIASYLGPRMGARYLPLPWEEDRTGMLVINKGAPWDLGGPTVFHSHWWLRAHWGRAFEIVALDPDATDHGIVTMRKREVTLSVEDLERAEPDEPREVEALRHNIEQLHAVDRTRWA